MGFTSTYSCDGLADKLKVILLAAGARADVKSQPGACASGFGRPDKFARADLTFYTLAPADPNAAASGYRQRHLAARHLRCLASRASSASAIASWWINSGNRCCRCSRTRNVVNNTTCIPHQESGSTIDLRFESLTAPPVKKHPTAANGAS